MTSGHRGSCVCVSHVVARVIRSKSLVGFKCCVRRFSRCLSVGLQVTEIHTFTKYLHKIYMREERVLAI